MEAQMEALISRLAMPLPEVTKIQSICEHLHHVWWRELDRLSASLPSITPLTLYFMLCLIIGQSFIPRYYHSLY